MFVLIGLHSSCWRWMTTSNWNRDATSQSFEGVCSKINIKRERERSINQKFSCHLLLLPCDFQVKRIRTTERVRSLRKISSFLLEIYVRQIARPRRGLWAKQKVPAGGGGAYKSCEDPESFLPKYNDSYLYFFFYYYKHSIVLPVIAS